jgi:UDPglucose--hexose-1-phosphate uridylyltransferase
MTPPESAALRPPGSPSNGPGWRARAIPNRFPTVDGVPGSVPPDLGTFTSQPGEGVHEVVIEGPQHSPGLAYLPPEQRRDVFRFLRDRVRDLTARPGIANVLLFENWGPESGGTLWHPHAQLVGLPFVPPRVAEERDHFQKAPAGGCLLESIVDAERKAAARLVSDAPSMVAYAPFASEHPFETWIVPKRHGASFGDATDTEVDRLAELLPAVLRALATAWPGSSYNWFVHGLGATAPGGAAFHWHVEVVPRLVRPDGFDLGAGVPVNPVAPEAAATALAAGLETPPKRRRPKR